MAQDEWTIKTLQDRREVVLNEITVEPTDYKTYAALYSELLEIDEELARLGLAALGDIENDGGPRCMISGGEVVEMGSTKPNVNFDFTNIPF